MKQGLDWTVLGMAAVMAGACGGDGKGDHQGSFERYLRGVCAKAVECAGIHDKAAVDECVAGYGELLCGVDLDDSKLAGVDDCLKAVDAASCDDFDYGPEPQACAMFGESLSRAAGNTIGKVGDSCNLDEASGSQVCGFGSYCEGASGQCGSCVAVKADGADCFRDSECKSDYCTSGRVCGQKLPMGAACTEDNAWDCVEDCVDGKCVPYVEVDGQPCTQPSDCDAEDEIYLCVDGKCVDHLPAGAACTADEECSIACDNGKCAETAACGEGEIDDYCSAFWGSGQCKEGLTCDYETGRCKEPPRVGEACTGYDCTEGAYCEALESEEDPFATAGTCKKLKADGAACESSDECASDTCDFDTSVCVALDHCTEPSRMRSRSRVDVSYRASKAQLQKTKRHVPPLLRGLTERATLGR